MVTKDPLFLAPVDTVTKIRVKKKKKKEEGILFTVISPYRIGFENQSMKRSTDVVTHTVYCTVTVSFRFSAVLSQELLHNSRRSAQLWIPPNTYRSIPDKVWRCAEFIGQNHK
jgi:hypothetical protein